MSRLQIDTHSLPLTILSLLGAEVSIRGVCQLAAPISLTARDSGSEAFPIVYNGYGTGKIIGGVAVKRSQAKPTASPNIFKVHVPRLNGRHGPSCPCRLCKHSHSVHFQIDFASVKVQDMGIFHQHTYLGGNACVNLYLIPAFSLSRECHWSRASLLARWYIHPGSEHMDGICSLS
jgi:hypothetical protein